MKMERACFLLSSSSAAATATAATAAEEELDVSLLQRTLIFYSS